jgi:hypothetical protein
MSWMLDDLQETLDIQEDETSVTQIRKHIVIQIHDQVEASAVPSSLAIGDTRSSITYNVGGTTRTNNPKGSGKFYCVGDGISPLEHPSTIVVRRQTWEYFGPWQTAPADWNI